MGFTFVNELPTPDMIREQFPGAEPGGSQLQRMRKSKTY